MNTKESTDPLRLPANCILVVDDDEDTLELEAEILHRDGYPVVKAKGGAEALIFLTRSIPIIILIDLVMAPLSGIDVLDYIYDMPDLRRVPIVLVTTLDTAEVHQYAALHSVSAIITKPVRPREILERVRKVVDDRSRELEKEVLHD